MMGMLRCTSHAKYTLQSLSEFALYDGLVEHLSPCAMSAVAS